VLDKVAGTVTEIDPGNNTTGEKLRVGSNPSDITVGLGAVWVSDLDDRAVYRIDPVVGDQRLIRLGSRIIAVAVDETAGTIWVLVPGFD
jgi:hypothetical protein